MDGSQTTHASCLRPTENACACILPRRGQRVVDRGIGEQEARRQQLGKGADLKPCGSLERGLILSLLAHMKEASWCLRKGIDTATWALWDRGRIPGFFALVRVARSRPLCRLGKGRIPGPLAPRKGGATLPATLQVSLKTNICNPLISEGLQVGLRPLSGVPKGTRAVGWGDGQKNPGAGGSAPKGFGWVYECGI